MVDFLCVASAVAAFLLLLAAIPKAINLIREWRFLKRDRCPKCGSKDLFTWATQEVDDGAVYTKRWKRSCHYCGRQFVTEKTTVKTKRGKA